MSSQELKPLLPGEEFVAQGLADLAANRLTDCSLLVLIAAPRLKRLGIQIPDACLPPPHEHHLYSRLEQRLGSAAHSYYNSLLRRIISYSHALERERSHS